jgi:hypothetical protein
MRSRAVLLLAVCCAAALVLALLTRLGNERNNQAITRNSLPWCLEDPAPAPELDRPEASPFARTEAAPIPSFCERIDPVLALPESTSAEVTSKRVALQAVLVEVAPKGTIHRLRPGLDWKTQERAANPDLWAASDELFRLQKLEREMRYADYLAASRQAGASTRR